MNAPVTCCVCHEPIEPGQRVNCRINAPGPGIWLADRHWHASCGPIDMDLEGTDG